jgi:alpha-tubulin suppressor-like RCC1 family protein/endonuclease/exonuclease/phosphatase family metal-dependent hydrolase
VSLRAPLARVLLLVLAAGAAVGVALPDPARSVTPYRQAASASSGRAVSSGGDHSCEVRRDGTLWCWGSNTYGQLGLGQTGPGGPVAMQVGASDGWLRVDAGGQDTCAVRRTGTLYCWGVNHRGQLGDGTTKVRSMPVRVGPARAWRKVSTGWFHTCAIRTNKSLWCWGDDSAGQLGVGSTRDHMTPTRVGSGRHWTSVSVEGWNTCAIKDDHTLWCWGRNLFGQLGDGSWADSSVPREVTASRHNWRSVALSWTHACGIKGRGVVKCWGRNLEGQLGHGDAVTTNVPEAVIAPHDARAVAVSEGSSCLVDAARHVWCWGDNDYGQVDPGSDTGTYTAPLRRPGSGTTTLSGGWLHFCSLDDGSLRCWGNDEHSELGTYMLPASPAADGPSVAPTSARRKTGLSFTLATFNVLGNEHSRPYAKDDKFAPSRLRAEWAANAIANLGATVVGLQEASAGQLQGILDATGGTYASFQTPAQGDRGVESSIIWDTRVWQATETRIVRIPFISRTLPRPVVRLRDIATGREIYVFDVHNAPWDYQGKRNVQVRQEIGVIQELEASGLPVFFVGDMNEKRTVFCKVVGKTGLVSPLGGSASASTCHPPTKTMRVDWIFGSETASYGGYQTNRNALVRLSTDHWVPVVHVTVP